MCMCCIIYIYIYIYIYIEREREREIKREANRLTKRDGENERVRKKRETKTYPNSFFSICINDKVYVLIYAKASVYQCIYPALSLL